MSDRRAKKNIDRIGTRVRRHRDGERKKLPIYEYEYARARRRRRHVGPMAQDVEKIDPRRGQEIGGVKHIDTGRVMGSILRAA